MKKKYNLGFTIIELIVVIAIMSVLTTMFLLNYAGLRGPRNLKLAQNELVSNIRKIQSYTLSARDINSTTAARYYIIKLVNGDLGYSIQAVGVNKTTSIQSYYDGVSNPLIETLRMQPGISVESISVTNKSGVSSSPACVQIGFSLPFSKIYMEYDDVAVNCNFLDVIADASTLDAKSNHTAVITIKDSASGKTRTVTVRGVTGVIEAQ